ncbi:MAG: phospholipid scramblase-related protein [Planctomycetota bacterium]
MFPVQDTYFIREHVGMLKLADTYDILDPATQQTIGVAREQPGVFVHVLRFLLNKQMLPMRVAVYLGAEPDQAACAFTIKRGFTLFRSRVDVEDASGSKLGWFKSKALSLGGAFRVFDENDQEVALVKGDWKGWHFRFLVGEEEIGTVSKQWSGIGKELFTSADNFIVSLRGEHTPEKTTLLLAAALAIDIVFKEG